MTNETMLNNLTGGERRDYLLSKMFYTYADAEKEIEPETPLYYKLAPDFRNHPSSILAKYDSELSNRYYLAQKSTSNYKDYVCKIVELLNDGDYSNEPIKSDTAILAQYLK